MRQRPFSLSPELYTQKPSKYESGRTAKISKFAELANKIVLRGGREGDDYLQYFGCRGLQSTARLCTVTSCFEAMTGRTRGWGAHGTQQHLSCRSIRAFAGISPKIRIYYTRGKTADAAAPQEGHHHPVDVTGEELFSRQSRHVTCPQPSASGPRDDPSPQQPRT